MLVKWDHFPRWKLKNIWNDLKHLKRPIYFPKCNKNLPIKKSVQRISGTLTLPGVPPTLPWGLDWIRRPASTSWKICAAWQLGPSTKPPPNRRDTHRKAWGFNDFFVMFSTKNAEIKWITLNYNCTQMYFFYIWWGVGVVGRCWEWQRYVYRCITNLSHEFARCPPDTK